MREMTETEYRETMKAIEDGAWRTKPHAEVSGAVVRHRAEAARCERAQLGLDRVQAILRFVTRQLYIPSMLWVSAHPAAPWRACAQSIAAVLLALLFCFVLRRRLAWASDRIAQIERWHVSIAMGLADVRDALARAESAPAAPRAAADSVYRGPGVRVAEGASPARRPESDPSPHAAASSWQPVALPKKATADDNG